MTRPEAHRSARGDAGGHGVHDYLRASYDELPSPDGPDGPPAFTALLPVDPHLRGSGGGMSTGTLAAAIDSVAGLTTAVAVAPDWAMTTNLMLQAARLAHTGPLRLAAEVPRLGRSSVVVRVTVTDEGAGNVQVASCIVTNARMAAGASMPPISRPVSIPLRALPPEPLPVDDFFGIVPGDGLATRLTFHDRLRNAWDILHGGAIGVLVEAAAVRAAGADPHVPPAWGAAGASGLVVHYLSPVRLGPPEARCTVLGWRGDEAVVRVTVHDTGADDKLAANAWATVRPVESAGVPGA